MPDSQTPGRRIAELTQAMLAGSVHYLRGAIELAALRHEVGAYANDPDFIVFVAILAEIESLPEDMVQRLYANQPLPDCEQLSQSEQWARELSLSQCESLMQRYRQAT